MGYYHVAQVCLNGHVITSSADFVPDHCKKFYPDCGQPTITKCPHCQENIQGDYERPGFYPINGRHYKPPAYCVNCGNPYPWTLARVKAAEELIAEDEELNNQEKRILKKSLPDLVNDTPGTQLAATRFRKFMKKAALITGEGLKQILIDIISESTRKLLWP